MFKLALAAGVAVLLLTTTAPVQARPQEPEPFKGQGQWLEVFSEDGTISRVRQTQPIPDEPALSVTAAAVTPIEVNGPSSTKFDLVFVGDGYTSSQLGTYAQHVQSKFNEIMAFEPFKSHRTQFNAWRVDVISSQSGVDNDPTQGVLKNTALDMYFWCNGIERLLCVNQTKAQQQAAAAPDADQILALGNSTKYGGAGGGVATASGGHASAGQIAIHELGHSIGRLADEYDYGDGACYTGGEPVEPNVSKLTAAQMQASGTKWRNYLGQSTPDGGTIGTYEGARYFTRCIYRPSVDSIMRTLGRQFNSPSRDEMIKQFYIER
ncbi:M64 family metallopeptidase [Allorhizocola rhizosphaerae]|uniref:M64 family metallopeptidase n=1 Tax=Allorhizocola rhizosphaerae TaxID=1872709 RepID=UPI001FEC68F8|nr:M64 family metallopeptidase [Allorhizocola rhizosphaerae]